ncbi:Mdm20p [Sugiyamaella lignohabitans]|uniref:Mdm20p n=1 Tax=Sugiyamaella lignohabitans TaxID=796027 RepID=A0A167DLX2_9ASCO|nr:Mdm20p [Sugiyamaella lignohabitans]ANB13054.1 Mdm20p [Sugiyamaella lignohabitans]
MSSTTTRDIKALWDLINAGSYKQALVKVGKELKKSPNHPYWLALNAYISGRQNKQEESLELANRVAALGPTNLTIVSLLQEIYQKYGKDVELCSLFETAVRKSGSAVEPELLDLWLDSMIDRGYMKGFVQCSMASQKVTQSRGSTLQAALAMYLSCHGIAGRSPSATDSERKIFPMLASRMLDKIEPLVNAQEGYVRALVLGMAKTEASVDAQIEYLQSDVVKKWESLDLVLLLLESLEKAQKWDSLFQECVGLLTFEEGKHSLDNWLYWKGLVTAAVNLGGDYIEQAEAFINGFSPESRNSRLALVDLYGKVKESKFMSAVKSYFTALGNKRCAYEDLKPYVEFSNFNKSEFLLFLANGDDSDKSLDWRLNATKFQNLLGDPPSADDLIKAYNDFKPLLKGKDPKDYFSGDDFLLIAVGRLVSSEEPLALLKSIILLESAVLNDKHQFYMRLWLVQLYLQVGSFANAQRHYDSLSIKMIQNENISHSLLSRCSSIHPSKDVIMRTNDIYNQLTEITPYTKYALTKSAYTQIEGFIDLNSKLQKSLSRRLVWIEEAKIQRLLDPAGNANLSKFDEDFDSNPETYSDNRDFKTLANVDFQPLGDQPFSELLTVGPRQGVTWAKAFVLRENIIRRLITPKPQLLEPLGSQLVGLYKDNTEFTPAEVWSLDVIGLLISCSLAKSSETSYLQISTKLSELPKVPSLSWSYFHHSFTILETLKVVTGFLTRLRGARHQFKVNLDALDKLLSSVKILSEEVRKSALESKNSRNKRYQDTLEILAPWAEDRGISNSIVENILDGIGISQDKTLTLLRSISV